MFGPSRRVSQWWSTLCGIFWNLVVWTWMRLQGHFQQRKKSDLKVGRNWKKLHRFTRMVWKAEGWCSHWTAEAPHCLLSVQTFQEHVVLYLCASPQDSSVSNHLQLLLYSSCPYVWTEVVSLDMNRTLAWPCFAMVVGYWNQRLSTRGQ